MDCHNFFFFFLLLVQHIYMLLNGYDTVLSHSFFPKYEE